MCTTWGKVAKGIEALWGNSECFLKFNHEQLHSPYQSFIISQLLGRSLKPVG